MKRLNWLLAGTLLLPITARAQALGVSNPTPEANSAAVMDFTLLAGHSGLWPYRRSVFWGEVAALTASNIVDGYETVSKLGPGRPPLYALSCEASFPSGSSWLIGQHPSALRYGLTFGAVQAGEMYLARRWEKSKRPWLRVAGHALMFGQAAMHTYGAVRGIEGITSINYPAPYTGPNTASTATGTIQMPILPRR